MKRPRPLTNQRSSVFTNCLCERCRARKFSAWVSGERSARFTRANLWFTYLGGPATVVEVPKLVGLGGRRNGPVNIRLLAIARNDKTGISRIATESQLLGGSWFGFDTSKDRARPFLKAAPKGEPDYSPLRIGRKLPINGDPVGSHHFTVEFFDV